MRSDWVHSVPAGQLTRNNMKRSISFMCSLFPPPCLHLGTNEQDLGLFLWRQGYSVWCPGKSPCSIFMHFIFPCTEVLILRVWSGVGNVCLQQEKLFQNSCHHFYQSGILHEYAQNRILSVLSEVNLEIYLIYWMYLYIGRVIWYLCMELCFLFFPVLWWVNFKCVAMKM